MLASFLFSKLIPSIFLEILQITICKDCHHLQTFFHAFFSELGLLVIPLFIAIGIDSNSFHSFIPLYPSKHIIHCFGYIVASTFLSLALLSPNHCPQIESIGSNTFQIFESIVEKCILPAICEEIVFRGWMFHTLRHSTNSMVGGFITAVVFGLFHPWKSLISTTTITLFSCYWTYANNDTNSILPSILSHFSHNFILSVLPLLDSEVCRTPKFMSFMFWICGTVIIFLVVEFFRDPAKDEPVAFNS